MNEQEIREAISTLKMKNSEGYDWIPQRILIDNPDKLTNDLLVFNLIDNKQIISPDRFDPERDHIICPTILKGRDMKD